MVILTLLIGCSSGGKSPVLPDSNGAGEISDELPLVSGVPGGVKDSVRETGSGIELGTVRGIFNAVGLLGTFDLNLDAGAMTGELSSVRTALMGESFLVSGASFFSVKPCMDCFRIESVELTSDNTILVRFVIRHPFEKGDTGQPPSAKNRLDLDLFDLAMVIVPYSATFRNFPLLEVNAYTNMVVAPDGFTTELADWTNNPHVCPYFLIVDESGSATPDWNRFEMGTPDTYLPVYFKGGGLFRLYLTMGYGVSAEYLTRLAPIYYNPEFNKKPAWKVEVIPPEGSDPPTALNTWSETDFTTPKNVIIQVWDWQHNATVSDNFPDIENRDHIYDSSRIKKVSVEIRNMTSTVKYTSQSESGDGSPADPLIYKIPVANELHLPAGQYFGLVKVMDERRPATQGSYGAIDSLVHSPDGGTLYWATIPEFATYQLFTATVVGGDSITVTSPNGGETWGIGSQKTVMWSSTGSIANVSIDLSLNGGSTYTVPLAVNQPNTGSFVVNPVGNWPTQNARVRVYDALDITMIDKSDADFTIQAISGPIEVLTPNGGEVWAKGTVQNITWNADASITYVKIELSLDSGATYTIPVAGSTANDGIHEWNVPEVAVGTTNRIKISKLTDSSVFDTSDADFEITCPIAPPPGNVTATDALYPDKVVVYWDVVSGATGYDIYRDNILQVGNHPSTSWNDMTPVPGVVYYYQVATINSCGTGVKGPADPGEPGSACILPVAPASCTASDGTYTNRVEVTWALVPGASGYNIYRDFGGAPVAANVGAPPWFDNSVSRCVNHDYEVSAVAPCGEGPKSASDVGYSEDFPLATTGVTATDGDFWDKVTVSWVAIANADSYDIYRDTILVQNDFVGVTWNDTAVVQGVIYNYQIEGVNACGNGPIAPAAPGEPGNACVLPALPANVTATDGDFPDKVTVSWIASAGATGYNIYRDTVLKQSNYAGITWDDVAAVPGTIYNYQIEAVNACGTTAKSPPDPGEPGNACVLPATATGLNASDGLLADRVSLSWNAAADATSYDIYRDAGFLQNVVVTTYDDMTVIPGVMYTYEIQSVNTCGLAGMSVPDDGYAYACTLDADNDCTTANQSFMIDSHADCVDLVDEDWYYIYAPPKGIAVTSTLDFVLPAGALDVYVYGIDPGQACPGTLITSQLGVAGITSVPVPASTYSRIYIRLIGNTGQVTYTMNVALDPAISKIPIQIVVATDDGTPTGNWPMNGPTPLDLTILNNMITWGYSFWNQYGYDLDWDGVTVTIAGAQFYNIDDGAESIAMHAAHHINGLLSLYFVNQIPPEYNGAYCVIYPKPLQTVDNTYSVYDPNGWYTQMIVAHEEGHGFGYFFDEYLYGTHVPPCACGDNVCLGYTPSLFWIDNGCYAGNLMWYDYGWTWDSYDIQLTQWEAVNQFQFEYPANFPWF